MKLEDLINISETIEVMDIGAAVISETPNYKKLLDENLAHLNAFDGDTRQTEKIKAAYGDRASIYTDFLSDGTIKTLYIADELSGMTSVYKPNVNALRYFNGFENFGTIYSTKEIQTKKLDDVYDIPQIDMLKMDIQGSEL
ncbi:MAG: FkbM family methyltransferase, partial [Chlorobiaceae bacterium]|nr:FkbM family methyltransferase [Chlorobiaceae bacterium]